MKNLRLRFDRWCLKHRNKGLGNLMLYIGIGNLIVYLLTVIDPSHVVYSYLCFSRSAILSGQVWRLFSYVFTYLTESGGSFIPLLGLVALFCFYQFGKILESSWGTLRFNLYYLLGVILSDVAGLLLGCYVSAGPLNLSLFLALATIAPDAQVLLFFILPIRMKILAWVYLGITVLQVVMGLFQPFLSFLWLTPLVPLLNYFLFFGAGVKVLLPKSRQAQKPYRAPHPRPNANWANKYQTENGEKPYRHKCTVCGRTDTQYPDLEFRYCSKCNGYWCYCIDHINNHAHIQ